ncbi:MAG: hypothetical protein HY722_12770 [Planctomycetes bacterium]|nr:hypothetical protein [Planctomycetota bacterium]
MNPLANAFGWSLRVGRVWGIDVRVHWLLLFLAAAEVLRAFLTVGLPPHLVALWWFCFYVIIFLHEMGHCVAARSVGGDAHEIILWPLGGLAACDAPRVARPRIITSAGGPAVNALLAVLLYAGMRLAGWPVGWGFYYFESWPHFFANSVFVGNLILLGFNLLPALPLDGGDITRWALEPRYGYGRATLMTVSAGRVVAIGMGLYGLATGQVLLIGFALFAWFSCEAERLALAAGEGPDGEFGYDFSRGFRGLPGEETERPRRSGPIARWRERRQRQRAERDRAREADLRQRVDALLEKVNQGGLGSLSPGERRFLDQASRKYRERDQGPRYSR